MIAKKLDQILSLKTQIILGFILWNLVLLIGIYCFQGMSYFSSFIITLIVSSLFTYLVGFYFFKKWDAQLKQISYGITALTQGETDPLKLLSQRERSQIQLTTLKLPPEPSLEKTPTDSQEEEKKEEKKEEENENKSNETTEKKSASEHWQLDELEELKIKVYQLSEEHFNQQQFKLSLSDTLHNALTQLQSFDRSIHTLSIDQEAEAGQYLEAIEKSLEQSREVDVTAKEIVSSAIQAIEAASQASRASQEGISKMRDVSGSMEQVKKDVERILQQMTNLHEHSQRIYGVISIINEISNQINLLALNAAIEAAGAGQAGRRFSVVAKEIRRLANKTSEGTSEIEKLIDAMLEFTESSYKASERGKISTETTSSKLMEVMKSLNLIHHYVDNSDKVSQQISFSIQKQNNVSEQMSEVVSQANEVALNCVKNAKEISSNHLQLEQLIKELEDLVLKTKN